MIITGSTRCALNFVNSLQTIPNPIATLIDVGLLLSQHSNHPQEYEMSTKIILESLEATINISSIQRALLPAIAPEDTPQERQQKMQDFEARFPKIGLQILVDNGDGLGWIPHATVSLQNQGSEYYEDYLSPHLSSKEYLPVGSATKIGVASVDLGNGLIRGSDYVYIDCTYSMELIFKQPQLVEPGKDGVWHQILTLASNEQRIIQVMTCKLGYALSISASSDCRVRYYQRSESAQADASRALGSPNFVQGLCFDIALGAGVDAQGIQTTILEQGFRPGTVLSNRDLPRRAIGYLTVANTKSYPVDLDLSLTYTLIQ